MAIGYSTEKILSIGCGAVVLPLQSVGKFEPDTFLWASQELVGRGSLNCGTPSYDCFPVWFRLFPNPMPDSTSTPIAKGRAYQSPTI